MRCAFIYGCFVFGVVLLTIDTVNSVADWFQWSIDRAYNAGRDTERICASNDVPETCEKHNSNSGHYVFSGD